MGSEWTIKDVLKYHKDMAAVNALNTKNLDVMRKHGAMADVIQDLLDRQASAEPVGWIVTDGEGGWSFDDRPPSAFDVQWAERYKRKYVPLYTHPLAQAAQVVTQSMVHEAMAHVPFGLSSPARCEWIANYLNAARADPNKPCECCGVTPAGDIPGDEPVAQGEAVGEMNADRAIYFLRRFKHDEKMLGPNEQAALDFAIAALAAQPAQSVDVEKVREVIADLRDPWMDDADRKKSGFALDQILADKLEAAINGDTP